MLFEKIALTGQTYCSTSNSRNNKFLPLAATASDIFDQYYWDDSMKYVQLLEDWGFKSKYGNAGTNNFRLCNAYIKQLDEVAHQCLT